MPDFYNIWMSTINLEERTTWTILSVCWRHYGPRGFQHENGANYIRIYFVMNFEEKLANYLHILPIIPKYASSSVESSNNGGWTARQNCFHIFCYWFNVFCMWLVFTKYYLAATYKFDSEEFCSCMGSIGNFLSINRSICVWPGVYGWMKINCLIVYCNIDALKRIV